LAITTFKKKKITTNPLFIQSCLNFCAYLYIMFGILYQINTQILRSSDQTIYHKVWNNTLLATTKVAFEKFVTTIPKKVRVNGVI
jgi:hypothetical protein